MMNQIIRIGIILIGINYQVQAQTEIEVSNELLDSIYISDVEERKTPTKVLHAEPLYIDLIRDLGARKGEKEWNVGLGLTDKERYDEYLALVEYEWAPMDRLGLEVELPFSFYYPINGNGAAPGNKLNSLKLAGQYTFFVSEKHKTSLALGYIHEFEMNQFSNYREERIFSGNAYNPFFIAAKRWGFNYHTLIYTGPFMQNHYGVSGLEVTWQVNTNFHYMISGTRNFIGIEFNKEITSEDFDMIIRPQMRLGIAENLLIGIVTGIPVSRENERFSSFLRIIYEPGH
ncbi:HAEPLYID family protein [Cyclobacterium roseum]|uniref:HAEPLYID family protein n=1 Tax=Cyclobacterium roseum TaxID=2666137 RepID=UPI001F4536F5|nr:HAEPLYID family protein [Cyclobacterium roseum]